MAAVYADSFDHYATADRDEKGWDSGGSGAIVTTPVRHGVGAMLAQATGSGRQFRNLPTDYPTLVVGFGYRQPSTPDGSRVFSFRDSGTEHVDLRHLANGRLRATRNGTTLGDGTLVLSANQWYYIEIKVTIHDSTGVFEVHVNEVTDINLTGQDTRNGANASVNQIGLDQGPGGTYFDDLYIDDANFLGDVRVEALLPNGNGNSSQLVGSDGNSIDNYLLVDEAAPNGDTDYVESSTVSDKDTYAYGNLTPTTGTVHFVQPCLYARKTDAGVRSIASIARHSGTEVDSASHTLNTTYQYFMDQRPTKPGGGAWSISDVNGAEFGVKVTA